MCVSWLIRLCDMTHSYVCHDSSVCMPWRWRRRWGAHKCVCTCSYARHDSCVCVTTHSCVRQRVTQTYSHDSFIYVCHDSFIYVCHDSFLRVWESVCVFVCERVFVYLWEREYLCAAIDGCAWRMCMHACARCACERVCPKMCIRERMCMHVCARCACERI